MNGSTSEVGFWARRAEYLRNEARLAPDEETARIFTSAATLADRMVHNGGFSLRNVWGPGAITERVGGDHGQ